MSREFLGDRVRYAIDARPRRRIVAFALETHQRTPYARNFLICLAEAHIAVLVDNHMLRHVSLQPELMQVRRQSAGEPRHDGTRSPVPA